MELNFLYVYFRMTWGECVAMCDFIEEQIHTDQSVGGLKISKGILSKMRTDLNIVLRTSQKSRCSGAKGPEPKKKKNKEVEKKKRGGGKSTMG